MVLASPWRLALRARASKRVMSMVTEPNLIAPGQTIPHPLEMGHG